MFVMQVAQVCADSLFDYLHHVNICICYITLMTDDSAHTQIQHTGIIEIMHACTPRRFHYNTQGWLHIQTTAALSEFPMGIHTR